MKGLMILLGLVAVGSAADCKVQYPLQVCSEVQADSVKITITSEELQNTYLPIVAFNVTGRIRLTTGDFVPFRSVVSRDSWDGANTLTVTVPTGYIPEGVDKLTVSLQRLAETVILK
jgi:hypothetical protein